MIEPRDEADLAEAVRGARGPLAIRGGGTRGADRRMAGEVLSVASLDGIVLHEPGALTLVARAGTPVATVEAALAAEGQRLAFEPMDHRRLLGTGGEPTIGGVVAANVSGPRRVVAGACRDFLLGLRLVDGTGAVVKNGGRVMKNVTGYDLVRLMAGSRGRLGVLSEVAFKVLPVPETEATLAAAGLGAQAAVAALSRALGAPFEVTGAAHAGPGLFGERSRSFVRIEGMAASVAYRLERLGAVLGPEWERRDADESRALWRDIRDVAPFAGRAGAVWRISGKPGDGPGLVGLLGGGVPTLCDWGGGLIWALVPDAGDARAAEIRGHLARVGGHATLVRGSERLTASVPVLHPEPAPVALLSESLRKKFDPRGVLNPGLTE